MSKKSEDSYNWWPLIIVMVFLLLLFAFVLLPAWKALGIDKELESHESLAERQRKASLRYEKLKFLAGRKSDARKKLRWKFIAFYAAAVFSFLVSVTIIQLILNYFLHSYGLTVILVCDGVIATILGGIYTIITWKKFSFADLVVYCGTKIKNWVYGKYLNIDEQIAQHELDMKALEPLLATVPETINQNGQIS